MRQHEGWCIWITGLPGSGKSTVAKKLLEKLESLKVHVQILSSDMLRKVMTPKPTYAKEERDRVYATLVFIAKLLTQNGINVIIDATGNRRRYRDNARKEIPKFIEAYVRCPLKICIERETKRKEYAHAPRGVYKKALTGKSNTVPGIGVPYEEPENPEVVVDSDKLDASQCAQKILETLMKTF